MSIDSQPTGENPDVQGHAVKHPFADEPAAPETEDVEGHARIRLTDGDETPTTESEEDAEGHSSRHL